MKTLKKLSLNNLKDQSETLEDSELKKIIGGNKCYEHYKCLDKNEKVFYLTRICGATVENPTCVLVRTDIDGDKYWAPNY